MRPRPLLYPTAAVIAGICLSEATGERGGTLTWLATIGPILAAVALFLLRRTSSWQRGTRTALLAVIGLGVGFLRHQGAVRIPSNDVAHALVAEPVLTRLIGDIVDAPVWQPGQLRNRFLPMDPPGRTRFVLAVREFRAAGTPVPATGCVRVSVSGRDLGLRMGERVELTGKLFGLRGPQNPGEADWARWSRLQGIRAGLSVDGPAHVRRLGAEPSVFARIVTFVRTVSQSLLLEPYADLNADDVARLLDTMVLGQRAAADRDLNEAFLRAGVIHALSVSGFHIAALASATWWLTRRILGAGHVVVGLSTLVVVLTYTVIAEPNAPILRAAMLGVLAAIALLSGRPLCTVNWLAFAALGILMWNPLELFRPAFQLSFVQVLALVTLVPPIHRAAVMQRRWGEPPQESPSLPQLLLRRGWHGLAGLIVASLVAWVMATPLVLWHFGRIAPWGLLGTVLLSVPLAVIIWLSFVTMAANLVLPPAGHALSAMLSALTERVLAATRLFGHLPGSAIDVPAPPLWLVVVTYAVFAGLTALVQPAGISTLLGSTSLRRPRRSAPVWVMAAGATLAAGVAWVGWGLAIRLRNTDEYQVRVLSVGNGAAAVVTAPGGASALFDAGTDRNADVGLTVAGALRTCGIRRLQFVCVSHDNFDHYSGLPSLLDKVPVERVWLGPGLGTPVEGSASSRLLPALAAARVPIAAAGANERLAVGPLTVEVLWPPADLTMGDWSVNDLSLVLRLHAGGRTVLLCGDIERFGIRGLLEADRAGRIQLAADVLIAPHHGSVLWGDTAGFLAAVNPEVIVISSGAARPTLERLVREDLALRCRIVNTHDVGAVAVHISRSGEIVVETPFATTPSR